MNHRQAISRSLPTLRQCHRSSVVFLTLVVAILILVNLPGQTVVEPDLFGNGKYGPHFEFIERYEHGWPFAYLRREAVMLNSPPHWRLSHWNVFEGVVRFDALLFIADIAIGLVIAMTATLCFELWRRQRIRLLQFYLRDLLILAGVVAVVASILAFHRSRHAHELRILQAIEINQDPNVGWGGITERVEWQPGGPSWLRTIVGDRPFESFDRVIGIDATGVDLKHAVELRHLKVVRVGIVSNRELELLEHLPQIEALDMCYCSLDDEGQELADDDAYIQEQYIRLPYMPTLRGLNLYSTAFRGDGLENIPSIEMLELTDTEVDDDSIPALSELSNLKQLSLFGTAISDSGFARLRKALPDCDIQR